MITPLQELQRNAQRQRNRALNEIKSRLLKSPSKGNYWWVHMNGKRFSNSVDEAEIGYSFIGEVSNRAVKKLAREINFEVRKY
jgi:hypothetical protein